MILFIWHMNVWPMSLCLFVNYSLPTLDGSLQQHQTSLLFRKQHDTQPESGPCQKMLPDMWGTDVWAQNPTREWWNFGICSQKRRSESICNMDWDWNIAWTKVNRSTRPTHRQGSILVIIIFYPRFSKNSRKETNLNLHENNFRYWRDCGPSRGDHWWHACNCWN